MHGGRGEDERQPTVQGRWRNEVGGGLGYELTENEYVALKRSSEHVEIQPYKVKASPTQEHDWDEAHCRCWQHHCGLYTRCRTLGELRQMRAYLTWRRSFL